MNEGNNINPEQDLYDQDITKRNIPGANSPDQGHFVFTPRLSTDPRPEKGTPLPPLRDRFLQSLELLDQGSFESIRGTERDIVFYFNTDGGKETAHLSDIVNPSQLRYSLLEDKEVPFVVRINGRVYTLTLNNIEGLIND